MKTLAYLFLVVLAIGCKKKNSTPNEIVTTEPIIEKSYRVNVFHNIYPMTGTYTTSIYLLINDTIAAQYRPVSTPTPGVYRDDLTNSIMSSTLTPVAFFKTGDNLTWRYSIKTSGSQTNTKYRIPNLYLIEKGSATQTSILKMINIDSIPFANQVATRDYSFKLP